MTAVVLLSDGQWRLLLVVLAVVGVACIAAVAVTEREEEW